MRSHLGDESALSVQLVTRADEILQVVGVVEDVVERGVDNPPEPALYRPASQTLSRTRSLAIRTAGPPADIADAVQRAVWSVDPDVPIYAVEPMTALVERRLGGFVVIANLMGTFALLSLALGAVGIYGVTAYAAGARTGEIGVRIAMGAERGDVIRMVMRQGSMRMILGLGLGLAAAVVLAGGMRGILVGVDARDPVTFATVTMVLALVSFVGLYVPARRAARVDPVHALSAD